MRPWAILRMERLKRIGLGMSMAYQKPKIDGVSIVALGSFNPAIFQPLWFSCNDLIGPEEAKGADIKVVHKEVTLSLRKIHPS